MWLIIEPSDVILFRESKPFTAGESIWARSDFPPSPLPFLGALRSKVLAEKLSEKKSSWGEYHTAVKTGSKGHENAAAKLNDIIDLLGGPSDYGQLQMKGPFLCQKSQTKEQKENSKAEYNPFFPLPHDLLVKDSAVEFLHPQEFPWPCYHSGSDLLLMMKTSKEGKKPKEALLLDAPGLYNYLLGNRTIIVVKQKQVWESEIRVGIQLGAARRPETGKYYAVEFTRLKDEPSKPVTFLVEFTPPEGAGFPETGLLALGGESRSASYKTIAENELVEEFKKIRANAELKTALEGQNRFKLYLAAPAIFDNGWFPDFLDKDYTGKIGSLKVKLKAAAVGKGVPVGGWDLARKRPKTMFRAAPAGSVYYFEKEGGDTKKKDKFTKAEIDLLFETFHFRSIQGLYREGKTENETTKLLREYGKAGFGLAFLGTWQKENHHV